MKEFQPQLSLQTQINWLILCFIFQGELSLDQERKLHSMMRKFESEILAAADVVCVTCIGAGDKRLKRFNFPIVCSHLLYLYIPSV